MGYLKRTFGYFIIPLAVCAASAYVAFLLFATGFSVEVPNLANRSLKDAEVLLKDVGLELVVEGESFDMIVPPGYVIEQKTPAGQKVKGRTPILVHLSKGPEIRRIPSVTGMHIDAVRELLAAGRLDIGSIIQVSAKDVEKGIVIAQSPEPDNWTGEPLMLLVSKGAEGAAYYCPNFKGMFLEDAEAVAFELGLSLRIKQRGEAEVVRSQVPAPGAPIREGEVVTLTVAGG